MLSFTLINASYLSSPFQISYPIVQMAMPINANDFLQKIDRNIDFSEGSLKKKILARGDKNETDCHCLLIVGNSVQPPLHMQCLERSDRRMRGLYAASCKIKTDSNASAIFVVFFKGYNLYLVRDEKQYLQIYEYVYSCRLSFAK